MLSNCVGNISSDLRTELTTVLQLCEIVNTPRSLAVHMMLSHGEWQEYLDLTIDPSSYEDHSNFADDYLVTEVLRKSPNLPLGIDRSKAALDAFLASEAECKHFNQFRQNDISIDLEFRIKRHVGRILGNLDKSALEEILSLMRFGPGANTGVRGRGNSPSNKYDNELHLTVSLIPFYRSLLGENWWEHQRRPQTVVEGSKFTTVPKSAKTDRPICVEPQLNMFVQKGIGSYLRGRLRRFGIDIQTQEKNQDLAQKAYSCDLATIDLSAASDSVSSSLIMKLLPSDWYHLFEICRSPAVTLPSGEVIELEKWSSMGNGYTFELETLIFASICKAIVPSREHDHVSVYGDDLIVPQKYANKVIEALDCLGFRVNTRKSFLAGNFFESCGTDWFKGYNVRPFYLKGSKENIPYALQIANRLRIYSSRRFNYFCADPRFKSLWHNLARRVPRMWRCRVPLHFGDVGLVSSREEARGLKRLPNYGDGWSVRYVRVNPVMKNYGTYGVLLSYMNMTQTDFQTKTLLDDYSLTRNDLGFFNLRHLEYRSLARSREPLEATKGCETVRGYMRKPRTKRANVVHWPDGLNWLDLSN